ncbi:SIMPL domain-containing protein [Bacillus solimangrovi]|uniref:SIMPL domain-containing protein n=1 Tax=Bacillus solimangrovi TaxID=1305675 RepID=A0A1E5LF36_9BACI|nr:SIMPL domain-containing protein [Bacillus solimangrovi]OEH92698.1 hypothetical protein BFG57_01450 [Bacillus solimangrovi]
MISKPKTITTLHTTGIGTVYVVPNQAIVTLGVITEGTSLTDAQNENSRLTNNVINGLGKLGIPNNNIQTSNYRIYPKYDYKDGIQIFQGFTVTHLLKITVDEIDKTGLVVDTSVKQGANQVTNIQLTISNEDWYYQEALSKAVCNAQYEANVIARTIGILLNPVPHKVTEISNSPTPYPSSRVLSATSETTPISTGQIKIDASVKADFFAYC